MRIEIVVFDGFDELDVFGPFEVLSMAGLTVELVAAERPGPVTSMRSVRLEVPTVLGRADGVIVPGGGWLNRAPAGAWAETRRGVLPSRLAAVAPSTRWMASVCTGGLLLAAAGLLADRQATTNHNAYEELRSYGVDVVEERVVDAGDRLTAGALSAGLDLGLWITERELGTATADRVATSIGYARTARVFHARGR
ncbi:DJ-1/PfpI family protein [Nonomuraea jabiensis]|uniref:Transcriptional regulator GlxA family with amidase domain n=1 Tax=Nonomuraea jabiensis TaxID=882448 RepID=A0A7W9G9E2_9ACTN|nr:DJ-1/PfpI family protein [Nonomuraea jabiensis]MBB5779644.1 transcriptional regulator GlxA family with amidase domain [Nonomuraea jabiensis]